jgi:septum site-determining protein MinD
VVGLLSSKGIEAKLIINRIDFEMVRRGDMLSVRDVQDILGIEIIGVVERDDQIISAANCGEPVVYNQKSKAGQAFTRIAARVCGEQIPVPSFDTGSLWSRISRKLGVNA